jgi:hypothetical protein
MRMSFTYAYKSRRAGQTAPYGMPYVPVQDRRYVNILHVGNGLIIHIIQGAGNLFVLLFNSPPEVALCFYSSKKVYQYHEV